MIINPTNIALSPVVGLDLETNGLNPRENDILVLSLSTDTETYVLGVNEYPRSFFIQLFENLKKCDRVIAHNAKFDASFLYAKYRLTLKNWFCTLLASQILDNRPDAPSHSLVSALDRYLGISLAETSYKKVMQRSFIGLKKDAQISMAQYKYAGDDTKYLKELSEIQIKKAKRLRLDTIIREENRLLPVIVKMEVEGCLIDVNNWRKEINGSWEGKVNELEQKLDSQLRKLSKEFPQLRGKYTRQRKKQSLQVLDLFGGHTVISNTNEGNINYDSQSQILELFKVLNLSTPENKYGKPSVDENSLKTYTNENPTSPILDFIETLLEYREFRKLISTYGETFLAKLDKRNCIHTHYTQCRTATGRLSSHAPNLQNIPSRGVGKVLRQFFIAKPHHKLITCDMNSAEVAIAADYSQEPLLLNSILNGEDMHSKLATVSFSIIFGEKVVISKSEEPMTIQGHEFIPDKLRTDHKSVLFAKFYKAGKTRIYQVLAKYINLIYDKPEERLEVAGKVSRALDAQMPKLTAYLSKIIKQANQKGYLRGSKLGRIRNFKDDVYGEAANFPIQNTNAEAMKIALIKIDDYLSENRYGRIVMNIHDEVVVEAKEEHVEEVAENVQRIMSEALSFFLKTVKGGASAKINYYWEK